MCLETKQGDWQRERYHRGNKGHRMMGMMWRKTVGRRGGVDKDDALSGKEQKCEQQAYDVFAGVELEAW